MRKRSASLPEGVNTGKYELFDEAVAPDCVDHDPAPGQGPEPQGYRTFFTEMRTAFPDFKADLAALVADEESIAFAYTLSGTHKGPLMGIPRRERRYRFAGCNSRNSATEKWWSDGAVQISSGCFSSLE